MVDRIEREIEEILARLDDLPEDGARPAERKPISIADHRDRRKAVTPSGAPRRGFSLGRVNPAAYLLGGASAVVGGLLLANVWAPLIWTAFAGLVLFLGGFVASFFRTPRPQSRPNEGGGHFWRDRYIEYEAKDQSSWSRLRRRFRR